MRNAIRLMTRIRRRPANPGGAEPIVFLPLVEDDLQAAQPDGQQAEADAVELARMRVLDIRRVLHVARDHEDGEDADRNVDVERPAPRISIGEPAAQRGPQHGRDHYAEREHRHRHAALLRRKTFQQDRLRQRLQRASASAPCTARAIRIIARLVAEPQANDETVKMTMQVIRNRLRPKRSENQPLAGRIMALATR